MGLYNRKYESSENDNVSPIAYATNRLLNKQTYDTLPFPYNQTTLLDYAVVEKRRTKKRLRILTV